MHESTLLGLSEITQIADRARGRPAPANCSRRPTAAGATRTAHPRRTRRRSARRRSARRATRQRAARRRGARAGARAKASASPDRGPAAALPSGARPHGRLTTRRLTSDRRGPAGAWSDSRCCVIAGRATARRGEGDEADEDQPREREYFSEHGVFPFWQTSGSPAP